MPTAQSIETKPAPRTPAYWEIASPAERTATRVFARAHFVSDVVISSDGQFALSGSWDG